RLRDVDHVEVDIAAPSFQREEDLDPLGEGADGDVVDRVAGSHSGLMPASFTTFAQRAFSARMNWPNSDAVMTRISEPSSMSRFRIVGSLSTSATAAFNRCTTSAGV